MKNLFDKEKSIEIIHYFINNGVTDLDNICKAMAFADNYHLSHYGFFMTGDRYIAMRYGPVPSGLYDVLKEIRGEKYAHGVKTRYNDFYDSIEANMDYLSISNVTALNYGINKVKGLGSNFSKVHDESINSAYKKTEPNEEIDIIDIAKTFENSADIIDYINR